MYCTFFVSLVPGAAPGFSLEVSVGLLCNELQHGYSLTYYHLSAFPTAAASLSPLTHPPPPLPLTHPPPPPSSTLLFSSITLPPLLHPSLTRPLTSSHPSLTRPSTTPSISSCFFITLYLSLLALSSSEDKQEKTHHSTIKRCLLP